MSNSIVHTSDIMTESYRRLERQNGHNGDPEFPSKAYITEYRRLLEIYCPDGDTCNFNDCWKFHPNGRKGHLGHIDKFPSDMVFILATIGRDIRGEISFPSDAWSLLTQVAFENCSAVKYLVSRGQPARSVSAKHVENCMPLCPFCFAVGAK